jgi:opacity protein-like surface antigen
MKQEYIILKCILVFIITGTIYNPVFSQDQGNCAEKLKTAQTLFERGQVDQVPALLNDCLKSGFSREESLTAYKLLIQSFLFEDNEQKADSTMMEFLSRNPEYKVSATDHSSFVHLYNNFNLKKVVQLSVHLGTNIPNISVIKQISHASIPGKNTYGNYSFNLYASIEASFRLTQKLQFNAEVGYSQISFQNKEEFMGFGESRYNEKQLRFIIPLTVTYDFRNFGKLTPYGRAGAGPSFILNTNAQASFENYVDPRSSLPGRDFDRHDARISTDLTAQLGAGLKFKIRQGFLFAEVRSDFGILNQSLGKGLYNQELSWHYNYIDDRFRINSLNFNLGYTRIFYKPLKKSE